MFLKKGFQAFISKPIEIERLDAVIREWVRDKEIERTIDMVNVNEQMIPDARTGGDRRAGVDRRSGIDRRLFGNFVQGIDLKSGLDRFGGNGESFLRVLRSFALNMGPLLDLIKNVSEDNLADYTITVHGIKGASRGISAEGLGDRAEALEKAAKEGNLDFVLANNAAFIEEAEKIVGGLDELLKQMAADDSGGKTRKDNPEKESLAKLYAACESYNMDDVDAVMSEIESFEYENDDGLTAWLRENVEKMNFTEIMEKLDSLK